MSESFLFSDVRCEFRFPDGMGDAFQPAWRTETVLALAYGIRKNLAFDRLPILADALEEAGCDDRTILGHCRVCRVHHLWCWVLALVLPEDELYWSAETKERFQEVVSRAAQGRPETPRSRWGGFDDLILIVLRIGCVVFVLPLIALPFFALVRVLLNMF
jgi:hypothetical protein